MSLMAHNFPVPFEGLGTALAWWANVLGNADGAMLEKLLQQLYSPSGLNMAVARFNIGATVDAQKNINFRAGANVPKDINADPQLKVLKRIVEIRKGLPLHVEAFSNSPPQDLTVSGSSAGHSLKLNDNLPTANIPKFADFLIDAVKKLRAMGIPVDSLSPINEPTEPVWIVGNNQEGCYWSDGARTLLARILKGQLASSGLSAQGVKLALAEENNILSQSLKLAFVTDQWADVVNIHTYRTDQFTDIKVVKVYSDDIQDTILLRSRIRDAVKASGKHMVVSEFGLGGPWLSQNIGDVTTQGFTLIRHVVRDIDTLDAIRWSYWQAVENTGNNWGMIQVPFGNPTADGLVYGAQYWAFWMLSRVIPPGTTRIDYTYDDNRLLVSNPANRTFLAGVGGLANVPASHNFTFPQAGAFTVKRLTTINGVATVTDLGRKPATGPLAIPAGTIELWIG